LPAFILAVQGQLSWLNSISQSCASIEIKGGLTVQPVPTPTSTNEEAISKHKEGGKLPNTIDQGNRKLISKSKIKNRIATE
jgi:hypothetical protein